MIVTNNIWVLLARDGSWWYGLR